MIQPNELRIGNSIFGNYEDENDEEAQEVCKVLMLDNTRSFDYSIMVEAESNVEYYDSFEPIPLTEEWLVKFGFYYMVISVADPDGVYRRKKGVDKNYFRHKNLGDKITIYLPYFSLDYYIGTVTIEHVHQLQNLYFALTGKELETVKK